jgi:hypothetical protein
VVAVSGPVLWLPLEALVPLQPPEAVHAVALVELHVRIEPAPRTTVVGFAARITVAAGTTVTVAVATSLTPSARVQVRENDVFTTRAPVLSLPLGGLVPLQPPDAVHDVELVEFHINVEAAPAVTIGCAALRLVLGRGSLLPGSTVAPQAAISMHAPRGIQRISVN